MRAAIFVTKIVSAVEDASLASIKKRCNFRFPIGDVFGLSYVQYDVVGSCFSG